jgi:hypothetical protein
MPTRDSNPAGKVWSTIDGFVGTPTGDRKVGLGEEFPADDPLVQANPGLFTDTPPVSGNDEGAPADTAPPASDAEATAQADPAPPVSGNDAGGAADTAPPASDAEAAAVADPAPPASEDGQGKPGRRGRRG